MSILRIVAGGIAGLFVLGCADNRAPTAPLSVQPVSLQRAEAAARQVQASGSFDAIVDFSTVTLTPKGQNCLLTVHGRIVFHGTIEGTANGVTSALEFGPCSEVAVNPPGTFPDVFKSEATFDGTVGGIPAHSNLLYMGHVAVGGAIDGRFIFSNGIDGRLDVDAVVAVGGDYRGSVVIP